MHFFPKKNLIKVYSIIGFFSFFVFFPFHANAATLSLSPATGNFEVGESFDVKVVVVSNDVPFNAISGTVLFSPNVFSVESISKANSVIDFWVTEPVISKNSGTVKFEGVALGGASNLSGTVITIHLRANAAGSGTAYFESGQVLANDGEGTDITGSLNGGTFYVKEGAPSTKVEPKAPPVVSPSPTPEVSQPAPTLKAPEIVLGTKYGALAILGNSNYPKAQTLITFISENGVKIFILGTADADGSFNILVPNSLKRGSYTVSAVMIKEDKTNSDTSNTIVIEIGNIFSDIGWQIWLVIALLILSIFYLLIRIYHHFGEGDKPATKRKLREAEEVIHKSFDLLLEDINERGTAKLNVAERRYVTGVKKDISDAEKIIDKKIKDIGLK